MVKKNIKREIAQILKELLKERGIHVQKIVIFGSYLKGLSRRDSDIDIIVVSEDFKNKNIFERVEITSGINIELVKKIMKPFDIMYYSDEEWEKGKSLIINTARKEGEIIYSG